VDDDRTPSTPGSGHPHFVWGAPPEPAPAPAPAPAARRRPRRATVALAGLALLGGVAGGGLSERLLDDPAGSTAAAPASVARSSVVAASAVSTDGTAESAAAAISPSVVTIAVSGPSGAGTGSGVVVRDDGYILTNEHVVAGAAGGSVEVLLSDGTELPARVVGTDPSSDLAVLEVSATDGLVAATFADSDALRVGQSVLAVGAPLGLSNTVTEGIVSTLHRPVRTGDSADSTSVIDAVQTDAAVNPGNSGGALVDLAGQVVGIPSAIATTRGSSGSIGVGFAIPSNDAAEVADEIIADGSASHAQIGVSVGASAQDPGSGAVLTAVTPGGPAADAGLQAGDVVTRVGERTVTDADSLIVAVRSGDPGASVEVVLTRDGEERTVEVVLGSSG
jgi:putative serine protease PepD